MNRSRFIRFLGLVAAIVGLSAVAYAASGDQSVTILVDGSKVGQARLEPGAHVLELATDDVFFTASIEVPSPSKHLLFAEDTTITEPLTLRAGDSIELQNGAQLMIAAPYDWQGTPTATWSWDGSDPATLSYDTDRDIDIFGQGSIMFMPGSGAGTIKYVEVDLQPNFQNDHYPLHWHFLGDESRGTVVEGVVVKNSTFRAYVPHASHGITFTDIIAQNIVGEAFWWNPPVAGCTQQFEKFCTHNNSSDTTVSRLLVDGVTQFPTDDRGYTLTAVQLMAGSGNSLTDSFVRGVSPTHVKDCSAYHWPSAANQNVGGTAWTFESNYGESRCHGIFVWQNDGSQHVIDGFTGGGIDHGAYSNLYTYRNIDVPYFEVHARYPIVEDSTVGTVIGRPHQNSGWARFDRVSVDSLMVADAGKQAFTYYFNDSTLTCENVQWTNPHPGSTVWIDSVECERT